MRNFEKIDTDKRPKINPQLAVNLGKCASCPLANRCAVVRLKQPEVVQRDDCQNIVETADYSGGEDNSWTQQKLSTKEQFADDSVGTVWATDLHLRKKLNEELEAEQRKKIELAATEKRRQAEERNRQELARKQKANQQRQLQKTQPKPRPAAKRPRFERKPKNGDTSVLGLLINFITGQTAE